MAEQFSCSVEAVNATVKRLGDVLAELKMFSQRDDDNAAYLASREIHGALDNFHDESSDFREQLQGSVTAVHEMLKALSEGVGSIDKQLADALKGAGQGEPPPEPLPPGTVNYMSGVNKAAQEFTQQARAAEQKGTS